MWSLVIASSLQQCVFEPYNRLLKSMQGSRHTWPLTAEIVCQDIDVQSTQT